MNCILYFNFLVFLVEDLVILEGGGIPEASS